MLPSLMWWSVWHTPLACSRTSTSPGPGSSISSSSGPTGALASRVTMPVPCVLMPRSLLEVRQQLLAGQGDGPRHHFGRHVARRHPQLEAGHAGVDVALHLLPDVFGLPTRATLPSVR